MDDEQIAPAEGEQDDDEFDYTPVAAPEPERQVPAYIAIVRIIAVLGMGLAISFGLFLMLVGVRGLLVGVPIALLSVPCYLTMRFAERLAERAETAGKPG
ncbi:MAG: hypothetical protein WEC75_07115 [Dehalococcoidia bacterium]